MTCMVKKTPLVTYCWFILLRLLVLWCYHCYTLCKSSRQITCFVEIWNLVRFVARYLWMCCREFFKVNQWILQRKEEPAIPFCFSAHFSSSGLLVRFWWISCYMRHHNSVYYSSRFCIFTSEHKRYQFETSSRSSSDGNRYFAIHFYANWDFILKLVSICIFDKNRPRICYENQLDSILLSFL